MNKLIKLLNTWFVRTKETFHLYPVSLATILLAFGLMMVHTWSEDLYYAYSDENDWIYRTVNILWVILPIFTAVTLFVKNRGWLLTGLVAGAVLWFTTSNVMWQEDYEQIYLWGFAFYSLMFLLPLWKKNQNNGFWNYCAQIFFVLVLGFVCSGILAISLALAIESIRTLFDIGLDSRWTETVMFFSFFFVLPVFVHVGLPRDWQKLENSKDYPHFFAPVSYYLLTPIALLYFGILTVYMAKILVTGEWPSGQVAYPVMYLSMLVFAFYFISYPWRKEWQKWFFVALLPFMGIYFWAMGIRIQAYGLTDLRYLGLLVGACVTCLSVYFAFVKRQRLQMMLMPLAAIAFVVSAGPLGVTDLPVYFQINRLENQLTQMGALQNGQLVAVDPATVDEDTLVQISSTVEYISSRDRMEKLQVWTDREVAYPEDFMSVMGLEYQPWPYYAQDNLYFDYYSVYLSTFNVTGYDALTELDFNFDPYYPMPSKDFIFEEGRTITVSTDENNILTFALNGGPALQLDIAAYKNELRANFGESASEMASNDFVLDGENSQMRVRIYFSNLNGSYTDETKTTINNMNGYGRMLVDFK